MTKSAPSPPQDLLAATFQGWGELTMAWGDAARRWWFTILEWAVDECAYTGATQTSAYPTVPIDASTPLRAEFHRATDPSKTLLAATCVRIGKTTDAALRAGGAPQVPRWTPAANAPAARGGPTDPPVLLVTIRPTPTVELGGYCGTVVYDKPDGTTQLVADNLYIYVATIPTLPW